MPLSKPRVIYQHQFKKRRIARRRPAAWRKEELSIAEILAWVDNYHLRTGLWPKRDSGPVSPTVGETWMAVEQALVKGNRGLPKDLSLARLLTKYRGVRNHLALSPFTERQILAWADDHYARTGRWPGEESGSIIGAPGETWKAVEMALLKGRRGLSGGSSLHRLLAANRDVGNNRPVRVLEVEQILIWADEYHNRTGEWPNAKSGPVEGADRETWQGMESSLRSGSRRLRRSSLARLLAKHRGMRNPKALPHLNTELILAWADAHHTRTGKWPIATSGPVIESPRDNWSAINAVLFHGLRGLTGGSSLARLLADRRGVRNRKALPRLSLEVILLWADAHFKRTAKWPTAAYDSRVLESPEENWGAIDAALKQACRGLPAGFSLARLLASHRGVRNIQDLPRLSPETILRWADAHHKRTGKWPNTGTGPILDASEGNWKNIDKVLRVGRCGLPKGSSLVRFLTKHNRGSQGRSAPRYRNE